MAVAVRFGARWSRAEFVALLAFAYVAPLWFVAGLGFIWLRHRSGHLIAPVFAHIATNSIPFAVAWFLA